MNIIEAIKDENLFRPFLQDKDGDVVSWANWMTCLRTFYSLPMLPERASLVKQCTGRDINKLPTGGFDSALILTGRRSGKSRIAAVIGAYEAACSGKEKLLAKGEQGMVGILSPTRKQSRIVKNYLRAIFNETPLLKNEIANETTEGFLLNNGILIEICVGDWRNIRGYSLISAIVDEICYFGLTEESKVRNDSELIVALKPSLATTKGKLFCISSPYSPRGWAYQAYRKNFGNDAGKILVWNAASRVMNPTLPQAVVDEALAEDLAAAKAEYLACWREDVAIFLPREVIEQVVVENRKELLPKPGISYGAFCDMSGGRSDDATLAIGHLEKRKVVVDCLRKYSPPLNPYAVIEMMAEEIKRYNLHRVTGDNYSAEFTARAFENNGIKYRKSDKPKSQLYLELLPRICSNEIEIPDDETLIAQLSNLERRTRSGGKDSIDHAPGAKDDLGNSVAGVCDVVVVKKLRVGGIRLNPVLQGIFE